MYSNAVCLPVFFTINSYTRFHLKLETVISEVVSYFTSHSIIEKNSNIQSKVTKPHQMSKIKTTWLEVCIANLLSVDVSFTSPTVFITFIYEKQDKDYVFQSIFFVVTGLSESYLNFRSVKQPQSKSFLECTHDFNLRFLMVR